MSGFFYRMKCWCRRHPWMLLLAVMHGPLLLDYIRGMLLQEHYRFVPIAVGLFITLLVSRRSVESAIRGSAAAVIVGLDLCFLAGAYWLNSPWLAAVGATILAFGFSWSSRDRDTGRRLTYLVFLLLLAIRLPLQLDVDLIHWLQRVTTSLSSMILHHLHVVHFSDGNLLSSCGKSFLVEEACSGVQSLFTVLFLSTVICAVKQRSWLHSVCLLVPAFAAAAIMNLARVLTIVLCWDIGKLDLSSGLSHEIVGYLCLVGAAGLLMSADHLLEFLFWPVPDIAAPGTCGIYWNPVVAGWNSLVQTELQAADIAVSQQTGDVGCVQGTPQGYGEQRQFPGIVEAIRPSLALQFFANFSVGWVFSRSVLELLRGLPVLAVFLGAGSCILYLRYTPEDALITHYEEAFDESAQTQQQERQETCLRALASLRPGDPRYRFRLALFLIENDQVPKGLQEIGRLTSGTTGGHAEARLWLVKQAMQQKPVLAISEEEAEKQLLAVIEINSSNAEAHQLLAGLYVKRKEWKLAEEHLSQAAPELPELYLALAKITQTLQRTPETTQGYATKAVEYLTGKLKDDRANVLHRVALAEAFVLADRESSAHQILLDGVLQGPSPKLEEALTEFEISMIDRRLSVSPYYRDAARSPVIKALDRSPGNRRALAMVTRLVQMGCSFTRESVQTSLTRLEELMKVAGSAEVDTYRILLGQLQSDCGEIQAAAETLEPIARIRREIQIPYARLLAKLGRDDEAREWTASHAEESAKALEYDPQDVTARLRLAEIEMIHGNSAKSLEYLTTGPSGALVAQSDSSKPLPEVYGKACLAEFDRQYGSTSEVRMPVDTQSGEETSDIDMTDCVELLKQASRCNSTVAPAIDRLAKWSVSGRPGAELAETALYEFQSRGSHSVTILSLTAVHAIEAKNYGAAIELLEQALTQSKGQDPMILNNLAVCWMRCERPDPERALDLANRTLNLIPNHPDALSTRAEAFIGLRRWDDALSDLSITLPQRAESPVVHRLLKRCYEAKGNLQLADIHGKRFVELESQKANTPAGL